MSDSKESSAPARKAHPSGKARFLNAVIGILIVLVIALLVNYIFGMFNPRVDLTENKVFTLSEGTETILDRIDTPVTVRFYAIKDREYVGSYYDSMARNVENLLAEYERKAGGNLTVKRFDPEPDTDAEDNAAFDGLSQGMSQQTGNPMYFGISVECLDRKETIPFIPNRPESLLEYDISRAILRAHDGTGKKIRIMTTMQIGGGFSGGNFQAPPQQPWFLVQDLRRDYEVEFLPATADEIPADTEVLILLHPYDVGEETQFAIDQYLLKGGKIIAAVDPNFFAARFMAQAGGNPMMPQQGGGGPPPSSNLETLFKAWGVKYVDNKVLADTIFQTQIPSGYSPTVLSIPQEAMNADDPVTMRLSDVFLIMPGAFEFADVDGITRETLIQSSPSNQLVSGFDADPTQRDAVERLRKDFQPLGTPRTIAARLSGSFKTAFPNGNPSQPPPPVPAPTPAPTPAPAPEPPSEEAAPEPGDETPAADPEGEGASEGEAAEESEGDDCQDAPAEETEAEPADKPDDTATKAAEPAAPAAPPAPPSLKVSEKDGLILLFADADFVHDQFSTQPVQNLLSGRTELRPNNDNQALFQNALELALGGTELINVRSRTSDRRVFTKLNEWQKKAEDKFQDDLTKFEEDVKEIETNINEIISAEPENIEDAITSEPVQLQLEKLRKSQAEMNKKVRSMRKEMKREFDLAQLMIKLLTTGLVPLLVALFGIGLAVSRKIRTAAR